MTVMDALRSRLFWSDFFFACRFAAGLCLGASLVIALAFIASGVWRPL